MKESLIEKIMRQTGCTLSEDGCEKFRAGCSSPCLGTPQDMLRLIEAGYGPKLEKYDALCGEHRRYYSRGKMKALREEFERKRESGIEPEENDSR